MKDFEDRIRMYLAERGWDALRPSDLAKSIMIEGGELLEIFQWENVYPDEIKKNEDKMKAIRSELADVMIYCFDLAVILDIDVKQMLAEKLEKVIEKYPASLFNSENRKGQDPGTEDVYREVKQKYRKEGKN